MAVRLKRSARALTAVHSCPFVCRRRKPRPGILRWSTMGSATILVIDDELPIRQFLRTAFEFEGFTVQEARDAEEGIRSATLKPPNLIILDLGLPDRDGSSIIERLRSWSKTPIIVLTVRSNEREKVRLLELGADDYVVKPFGIGELIARARATLRPRVATTSANDPVVRVGPLEINLATRSGTIDGKQLVLGPKEYLVLQILAQHAGKVVTRQQIMNEVWGDPHVDDTHYLRVVVRKLRKKIEVDANRPRILLTELGIGYRLVQ